MFKVKESPLKLIEIISIEHSVKTVTIPDVTEVNLRDSNIKVDFDKYDKVDNNDFFSVCLKLDISPKREKQGYKIKCVVNGYFFINDRINNPDATGLEKSALAIVISYSRAYIKTLTYNCRWGKYILPTFDMKDVVDKKIEKLRQKLQENSK
ncbi:MAG: hypothetical protein K9N06_11715 [Candidatus Cloacimonetes bacterium]|nr:hypothetical protein [Candidatus Cloacimonadota bacterium]